MIPGIVCREHDEGVDRMSQKGHERPKPSGCTSDRFRAEIGWMQWPLQVVARA
jgi:hypothetical protein